MDEQVKSEFPQNMHSILTTEHSTLASARFVINGEISSRVNLYFTILSSVLIAAAFIAQMDISSQYFLLFMWIALPLVMLVGLFTLARVMILSGMDMTYIRAINRIRHFYVQSTPEVEQFFLFPPYDDDHSVHTYGGYGATFRSHLISAANAISFTNSLLMTVSIGLLVNNYFGVAFGNYLPVSVLVYVLCYFGHGFVGVMLTRGNRRAEYLESRFPAPSEDLDTSV